MKKKSLTNELMAGYIKALDASRKTCLRKYGEISYTQTEQCKTNYKKKMLEKYGVDNYFKTEECKTKIINKIGCLYPLQNKELHDKALKNGLGRSKIKTHETANIWYQGNNEKIFLDTFKDDISKLKRGNLINYVFLNEERVYYPDFIFDEKIVYEIKSSWTWDNTGTDKLLRIKNKTKLKAAKNNGYIVYLILNGIQYTYKEIMTKL